MAALTTTSALMIAGGVAAVGAGTSLYQGQQARKDAKSAAADADARAKAAANELKESQAAASSNAQKALEERRKRQIAGSQSVYTSPLGIAGSADVARKVLLGQ
jgi:hypothetical protein